MDREQLEALRKKKNALIWAGGPAREIMRLARIIFREVRIWNPASARVGLASDHYSLVKRYLRPGLWPLALWHVWCAGWHVNTAFDIMGRNFVGFTLNELDVMTTVWAKAPGLLGGNIRHARDGIKFAFDRYPDKETMVPHTRALLLITLGEVESWLGRSDPGPNRYEQAEALLSAITDEHQLIRVQAAVGFYHHARGNRRRAHDLLWAAYSKACLISKDQQRKIEAECRKRDINFVY